MWWNLVVTRPEVREGPEMEKSMLWKDHLLSWQFAICMFFCLFFCPSLCKSAQICRIQACHKNHDLYDIMTIYHVYHACFVELVELRVRENSLWIMCFRYGSSALRGWSPWRINLRNDLATYELATRCFVAKNKDLWEKWSICKQSTLFFLAKGRTWQKSRKQWQRTLLYFLDTVMQKIETEVSDWQTNGSSVCRCYGQSWGSSEMLRTTLRGGSRHLQPKYAYCQCNFRRIWEGMIFDVEVCKKYQMVVYIWSYDVIYFILRVYFVCMYWHADIMSSSPKMSSSVLVAPEGGHFSGGIAPIVGAVSHRGSYQGRVSTATADREVETSTWRSQKHVETEWKRDQSFRKTPGRKVRSEKQIQKHSRMMSEVVRFSTLAPEVVRLARSACAVSSRRFKIAKGIFTEREPLMCVVFQNVPEILHILCRIKYTIELWDVFKWFYRQDISGQVHSAFTPCHLQVLHGKLHLLEAASKACVTWSNWYE